MNGRYHPQGHGANPLSSAYIAQGQQDAKDLDYSRSHARDLSGSRGRGPALPNIAISNVQSQQANSGVSPRSQSSASVGRSPAGSDTMLERRPSVNQNHYRQLSRAHSNHPQSRGAINVTSPVMSPLSPGTPGSASTTTSQTEFHNNTMLRRQTSIRYPSDSSIATPNASNHMSTASANVNGERTLGENEGTIAPKRADRAQTSKSRSSHNHHRSQSQHHHEQKSVGEYALHHLFNKVGSQAIFANNRLTESIVRSAS